MSDRNDSDHVIADENPQYGDIRTIERIEVHEMTSSIKNKGRVNLPFSNNDCDQEWVIPSFPLRDGLIDYNLNNPIDIHAGQII